MKILVTGAKGFIGQHLCYRLQTLMQEKILLSSHVRVDEIMEYNHNSSIEDLDHFCSKADFVFNLVGSMRPKNDTEFMENNYDFVSELIKCLKKHNNKCPVMLASSIQAELNNLYGTSKKAGENLLFEYSQETGARVLIYRFTNLFGKWGKPNYNSVISTFCYNIANDLPIIINDPDVVLTLAYIDDVIDELISAINGNEHVENGYCYIPITYNVRLGNIADMIYSFKESFNSNEVPTLRDSFSQKLFATYISYLPQRLLYSTLSDKHKVEGNNNETTIFKSASCAMSTLKINPKECVAPYWHSTVYERIITIEGNGSISLTNMYKSLNNKNLFFDLCGDNLTTIEVPPGYKYEIKNISSDRDLRILILKMCTND